MASDNHARFSIEHPAFRHILGPAPSIELVHEERAFPFAHEAGVYLSGADELYITSNQFGDAVGNRRVQVSRVCLGHGRHSVAVEEIPANAIHMANGGTNYDDGILFCAQGSATQPSGLFKMQAQSPWLVEPVLTSYRGRPFNSLNDVVVHSDGSIWFTDPPYGHDQGYRPKPSLPSAVYRYDPESGSVRTVADQFGRPNGICFSPDEQTVYITDTDQVRGADVDHNRAASVYAFDVTYYHEQPFLTNRRLFALADSGIPDGMKCDVQGNIYSGCGDGVNVWSPGGVLLGKVLFDGGVANLCFGRQGELFALNEQFLWRIRLDQTVSGALLKSHTPSVVS